MKKIFAVLIRVAGPLLLMILAYTISLTAFFAPFSDCKDTIPAQLENLNAWRPVFFSVYALALALSLSFAITDKSRRGFLILDSCMIILSIGALWSGLNMVNMLNM